MIQVQQKLSLKKSKFTACLPANPAKKSKSTRDKSKIPIQQKRLSPQPVCLQIQQTKKKSKSTRDKSILPEMSALNPEKTKSTDIKSKRPSFGTPPPLRQNGAILPSLRQKLLPPLLLS